MSETTETKPVPEWERAPRADQVALLEILAATLNALHETGYSFYSYDVADKSRASWTYTRVITDDCHNPSPGLTWRRATKKKPGRWMLDTSRYAEPDSRRKP